jgi:EAL domain-containing protein (putative c-di-GMP-specific phosphodiesterase class I)
VGFEALSRWQRPDGLVPPAEFIPIADETGIILPLNRLLIRQACEQLRHWQSEFPADPPFTISINISARQFSQPDLASQIGAILNQVELSPHCVDLEITETIAMADVERSAVVLAELKALGAKLSIDDFGTGYSSLSRLQGFPVDALKIDRAFVSKLVDDRETEEIVRIIVMLAHNLGLKVVAEGAELATQVKLLKALNCELAQGYFFSKPCSGEAIDKILAAAWQKEILPVRTEA